MVEFYLKLKPILRIITYLTYICWEIDNFVIKSDIFRRFVRIFLFLKKLSCYHDNCSRYFMFGKYNGFVSKARVSACMYFPIFLVMLKRKVYQHAMYIIFKVRLYSPYNRFYTTGNTDNSIVYRKGINRPDID